ncbi:MAG: hypothetical protein HY671_11330 [Chloroflexi bacterium]|nr:hypothetical protein [Chloroflexota bacterium]
MPIRKDWIEYNAANVSQITEKDGVVELGDAEKNVVFIGGGASLRQLLQEHLDGADRFEKAKFFRYEEVFMYTVRESELIQQHTRLNKKLPEYNEELF